MQSKEEKALLVLRQELPEYVVDSFICSGYDTLPVIVKMNEASILEIEQFITDEFNEDDCFKQRINSRGMFKFLPGHWHRILDFIGDTKLKLAQEQTAKQFKRKRKCETSLKPVIKKHAVAIESTEDTPDVPNQKVAFESIRNQVVKWQKDPK